MNSLLALDHDPIAIRHLSYSAMSCCGMTPEVELWVGQGRKSS